MVVKKRAKKGIVISKIHGETLPMEPEKNVAGVAIMALLDALDKKPDFGFDIEIDKRIKKEFPHKFKDDTTEVQASTRQPVQTVASATRTTKTGRRTVKLTPSQVAIAKKLGVPLEEYAKHVKEA